MQITKLLFQFSIDACAHQAAQVDKNVVVMPSRSPSKVKGCAMPKRLPPLQLLSQDRLALIAPTLCKCF